MPQKVRKCRACGSVITAGDRKCAHCHADLKKPRTTYLQKKKKALSAFLDKLLDRKINMK